MTARSAKAPAFSFYLSCDINLQVRVRISHLLPHGAASEGAASPSVRPPSSSHAAAAPTGCSEDAQLPYSGGPSSAAAVGVMHQLEAAVSCQPPTSAMHVVARLTSDGGDSLALEAQTSYANCQPTASSSMTAASEAGGRGACMWGEMLTFCVKYRDLPHDALLSLSVIEVSEGLPPTVVGGATLPLFNKKGRLKAGPRRLKLSQQQGKAPLPSEDSGLGGLEHLVRLFNRGDVPRVDWLDPLTMAEIRRIQQAQSRQQQPWPSPPPPQPSFTAVAAATTAPLPSPLPPTAELLIELPSFPHAVLYHQPVSYTAAAAGAGGAMAGLAAGGQQATPSQQAGAAAAGAAGRAVGGGLRGELAVTSAERFSAAAAGDAGLGLILVDTEAGRENPAELKAQKLARSLTRGVVDRDLKPNSDERRRIMAVLKLPPNKPLHADEKEMIWRFRYSLTQETRALTKVLKCVDWGDALEAKQAADLMREWVTIDVADALELLSPDFRNPEVRAHAVSVLRQKDDDELLYYLLQLVQALRYEPADRSPSAEFLIERAKTNPECAVMLHWYLYAELDDPSFGARASAVYAMLVAALQADTNCSLVWEGIRRQQDMRGQLAWITKELKTTRVRAARATQRLQEVASESGPLSELLTLRVPLPLDPRIMLTGLVPSESFCFRSAQLPLRLSYTVDPHPVNWRPRPQQQQQQGAEQGGQQQQGRTGQGVERTPSWTPSPPPPRNTWQDPPEQQQQQQRVSEPSGPEAGQGGGSPHPHPQPHHHQHGLSPAQVLATLPGRTGIVVQGEQVRCVMIYKKGDDLRQDQFILQMVSLMDRLLKRENLDLRMTPYRVLPTSSDDGLVEFMPSTPLSKVLSEHRTIHRYLAQWQSDPSGPFGLKAEALETFVRSCAGSCVATYILGVGDRHLDNLMLASDGRLFHIDFGYILGQDPKPFPPPMKICKEMVEAMGGQGSDAYVRFRTYACEAYNILRKSADLILSLFHLMAGASIEAIRADPEKAILKLQEKFRLDLNDQGAVEWMQALINESATALMPQIVETTHRWAQYWR